MVPDGDPMDVDAMTNGTGKDKKGKDTDKDGKGRGKKPESKDTNSARQDKECFLWPGRGHRSKQQEAVER